MEAYFDILRSCALFSGMQNDEVASMLSCLNGRVMTAGREQVIFQEGDPADFVGIVLQGTVRILIEDLCGNRTVVGQAEEGEVFGEAFSCAGVQRLPVSVVAVQPGKILLLDLRRVLTVCSNSCAFHNRLVQNLVRVLAERSLQLNQRLNVAFRRTTREKLMAYLLSEAKARGSNQFAIPFDRQELADYLGVDRSAMSAELSRMQKDGLLETHRSWFKLL